MFQKKPLFKPSMVPMYEWSERQRKVLPSDGKNLVTFEDVSCKDISSVQLDIRKCDLETMLAQGVVLDPRHVMHMLDMTDSYDVETLNERYSMRLYQYIKEHEQEFKDLLHPEAGKEE